MDLRYADHKSPLRGSDLIAGQGRPKPTPSTSEEGGVNRRAPYRRMVARNLEDPCLLWSREAPPIRPAPEVDPQTQWTALLQMSGGEPPFRELPLDCPAAWGPPIIKRRVEKITPQSGKYVALSEGDCALWAHTLRNLAYSLGE